MRKRRQHGSGWKERGWLSWTWLQWSSRLRRKLLPGVTELGVKLQSAAITGVLEQDRVTALVNEDPTGRTLKL